MVKKNGAALLVVVIIMSSAFLLAAVILNGQIRSTRDLKYVKSDTQAYYSAEAGANYVMAQRIKDVNTIIQSYSNKSELTQIYSNEISAKNAVNALVADFLNNISKRLPSDSLTYYKDDKLFNDTNAGYEEAYTEIYPANSVPSYNINLQSQTISVLYDVSSKGYYNYGQKIYYTLKGQFKLSIQINYGITNSDENQYNITTFNINLNNTDYKIYNKNIGTSN